jgi:RNA polymerase sigma-B factor
LGASEEETLQALESGEIAASLMSLESSPTPTGTVNLAEMLGRADSALCELETYGVLHAAFASLNEREREILRLRFFDELSQAKIAEKMNVSQMHVSRLQKRGLERLHALLVHHGMQDAGEGRAAWGYRASI